MASINTSSKIIWIKSRNGSIGPKINDYCFYHFQINVDSLICNRSSVSNISDHYFMAIVKKCLHEA